MADRPLSEGMTFSVNDEILQVNLNQDEMISCDRAAYQTTIQSNNIVQLRTQIIGSDLIDLESLSYEFKVDRIASGGVFDGIDVVFSLALGLYSSISSAFVTVYDESATEIHQQTIIFDGATQFSTVVIPSESSEIITLKSFFLSTKVDYIYNFDDTNLYSATVIGDVTDIFELKETLAIATLGP